MNLVPVTRTVNVTAEDIAKGKRNDCESCAVALAAQRTFPELYDVVAYYEDIRAFNPPADRPQYAINRTQFLNPPEVYDFIKAIDAKEHVQPFSFELTLSVNEAKLPLPPPTTQGEPAPI